MNEQNLVDNIKMAHDMRRAAWLAINKEKTGSSAEMHAYLWSCAALQLTANLVIEIGLIIGEDEAMRLYWDTMP